VNKFSKENIMVGKRYFYSCFFWSLVLMRTIPAFSQHPWVKIYVKEEGMYKVTGEQLERLGVHIDGIRPDEIQLFNNGGMALPEDIMKTRPDQLKEVAIQMNNASNSSVGQDDYFLFYGKPVEGWEPDENTGLRTYVRNPFTRQNVYWLTWGQSTGKRMQVLSCTSGPLLPVLNGIPQTLHFEVDSVILYGSGKHWYWWCSSIFDSTRDFYLVFPNSTPGGKVKFKIQSDLTKYSPPSIELSLNGMPCENLITENKLSRAVTRAESIIKEGANVLSVSVPTFDGIYLDWIEASYQRRLSLGQGSLFFTPDTSGTFCFKIDAINGQILVFDISDYADPTCLLFDRDDDSHSIELQATTGPDQLNRFAVIESSSVREAFSRELVERTYLRDQSNGADLVIVSPQEFMGSADKLKNFRERHDGLLTRVIDIRAVFDEFGWGIPDPTALRDFLKHVYDHWNSRPQFVLLLGDGHYDYRNLTSPAMTNWIPPYEPDFTRENDARTCDDWFTCVDGDDSLPDYAIGRIPAQTGQEAENYVQKVMDYESAVCRGKWQSKMIFAADDDYNYGQVISSETIFTLATERLSGLDYFDNFDKFKIYEVIYPATGQANEFHRPGATKDFLATINQGALILNYIGHGNIYVLSHEYLFNQERDMPFLKNAGKPFFGFIAACKFGCFDDISHQSGAEQLTLLPEGGAIAMIAASRDVYQEENESLVNAFYLNLFTSAPGRRIGDIFREAKRRNGSSRINDQKFHLFGDPTLRLQLPETIGSIDATADSFKVNEIGRFNGTVASKQTPVDFQGQAIVEVFDAPNDTFYLSMDKTIDYRLPGQVIYRGKSRVSQNRFSGSFYIPPDTRQGADCRISTYFWNADEDGWGYLDSFAIRGVAPVDTDTEGPEVRMEIAQGRLGQDSVRAEFMLKVTCSDPGGINLMDGGDNLALYFIGSDTVEKIDAGWLFEYETDSYTTGQILCPFIQETDGYYKILCQVYDNFHNLTRDSLNVFVTDVEDRQQKVLPEKFVLSPNYPNPFNSSTVFQYVLPEQGDVTITIFNSLGQQVVVLYDGYRIPGTYTLRWHGRDEFNIPVSSGVYFCRLEFRNDQRHQVFQQKMMLVR
jgi:hypothetical protein